MRVIFLAMNRAISLCKSRNLQIRGGQVSQMKFKQLYLKQVESTRRWGSLPTIAHSRERWLTAPRARSSTKRRDLPVRRGGKTLARAQHCQHNDMQTRTGFFTLRSADRCLEDRVHLRLCQRNRSAPARYTFPQDYRRSLPPAFSPCGLLVLKNALTDHAAT